MEKKIREAKQFITVLADGLFHQTVPEGTQGSVSRTFEDKEGNKQVRNELVFEEISGKITSITFRETDFGKTLDLEIDAEGVISLNTASNFGEDVMKKLPGMDLSLPYTFVPYSFVADNGKSKRGVSIYQDKTKIDSFYWNPMTKEATNGIPQPEGDTKTFDSDDWKIHFMKVRKFLIAEVEKLPQFVKTKKEVEF